MMNYIWAGLMGLCVFYAVLSGNIGALSEGVLSGAGNAVDIALRLLGAMILWNGIEEIISRSGLQKKAERLLSPFMKLFFRNIIIRTQVLSCVPISRQICLDLETVQHPWGLKL